MAAWTSVGVSRVSKERGGCGGVLVGLRLVGWGGVADGVEWGVRVSRAVGLDGMGRFVLRSACVCVCVTYEG